jgi:hypothetical protein
MSTSSCRRCLRVSGTLSRLGVCETCLNEADATTPADGFPAREPFDPPPGESRTPPDLHAAGDGLLPACGYALGDLLGEGGMGVVHKAEQRATGQTVAVKRLHRDHWTRSAVRRFVVEARALAAVDHPNVVRLYDFVPDPDDPTLVMEYVPGTSLAKRLKKGGPLPADLAAELVSAAARGVQAAHDQGVVHRDVKPANLLLTPDGLVKVADFGLSKELDAGESVTRTGHVVGGTPGFLAPEQVDERFGEPGVRTDVWGLGATLYALLTGSPPFPATVADTHRVAGDPVVAPRRRDRRIPPVLEAIVLKCLEKEPGRRYPTAAAVADDLDRYRREESTVARPLPPATAAWNRVRAVPRKVLLPWALLAAMVLVAVVAVLVPRSSANPEPESPQAFHERTFVAGEKVVLVPKAGLPDWSEWPVGPTTLGTSPGDDGSAYFVSTYHSVLKLFEPPAADYRVTADLRHWEKLDSSSPFDRVGLVLFHERFADAKVSVDRCLVVSFDDIAPPAFGNQPVAPKTVTATWWLFGTDLATQQTWESRLEQCAAVHQFALSDGQRGKWRRLAAQVSPDGVELLWGTDADATDCDPLPIVAFTADELNDVCTAHHREMKRHRTLPESVTPTWNPAGGLGVYAYRSELTFRSVSVRATPP